MNISYISTEGFKKAKEDNAELCMIDVRTEAEHAACHVDGVCLYPLQDFKPENVLTELEGSGTIYVLCKSGGRAKKAAEQLSAKTDRPIAVVVGGTDACEALGVPVNRGEKDVMSLERQVRIVAGALVVIGVAGSFLVHPGFIGLSAFVGAGLMFAGITDTCAMGMMLARMPWNKVGNKAAA